MLSEGLRTGAPKPSGWYAVTPERVRAFADATEDWQGIHLDEAAARDAGFEGPVAHGYLVLSMLSAMVYDVLPDDLPKGAVSVNYGFDRIRFIAPTLVGSRVRGLFQIAEMQERDDGVLLRWDVTVEREGQEKPALAADWLTLIAWKEDT